MQAARCSPAPKENLVSIKAKLIAGGSFSYVFLGHAESVTGVLASIRQKTAIWMK